MNEREFRALTEGDVIRELNGSIGTVVRASYGRRNTYEVDIEWSPGVAPMTYHTGQTIWMHWDRIVPGVPE